MGDVVTHTVSNPEKLKRALAARAVSNARSEGRSPWEEFQFHLGVAVEIAARMDPSVRTAAVAVVKREFALRVGNAVGQNAADENAERALKERGRPSHREAAAVLFGDPLADPEPDAKVNGPNRQALMLGLRELIYEVYGDRARRIVIDARTRFLPDPVAGAFANCIAGWPGELMKLYTAIETKWAITLRSPATDVGELASAIENALVEADAAAKSGTEALS